ncbi:hypothetical protein Pmi06nite_63660 [Planotetraspora mira]|uniref:Uncharacterized protein n=1 Tax=Planotetraspora mira TaxID=58121 RepID=A0A8J3TYU0_9ACTN|nr:hypothetical protein Pmi06nite_63660 [Planotetraspora mira]
MSYGPQAGLFGGGGLGDFAITYGSQRYNWPIVYITVATIVVIVQAGQFLGNWLARSSRTAIGEGGWKEDAVVGAEAAVDGDDDAGDVRRGG